MFWQYNHSEILEGSLEQAYCTAHREYMVEKSYQYCVGMFFLVNNSIADLLEPCDEHSKAHTDTKSAGALVYLVYVLGYNVLRSTRVC